MSVFEMEGEKQKEREKLLGIKVDWCLYVRFEF